MEFQPAPERRHLQPDEVLDARPRAARNLHRETATDVTHLDQDIDLHIGRRMRARRRLLGLTQPELASAVGVKFQQIQKYECGEDRISASRLWLLCAALKAPVDYFYEGLSSQAQKRSCTDDGREDHEARRHARELIHSYERLGEQPRRALLELAKSLGDKSLEDKPSGDKS
jgi:transcriptional regulator with XRE-family HTH domain